MHKSHPLTEFHSHLIETLEFFERVIRPVDERRPRANFESEIGRRFSDKKFVQIHRQAYCYQNPLLQHDPNGFAVVEDFLNQDQIGIHETLFNAAYSVAVVDGTSRDICERLSAADTSFRKLLPMRMAME